ncbi:SAM-dependent methyltransferase [Kribbella albertanoniae]|nr:SAM-dependent methyltransferase [Kribbella albertanoniae]
MNTKHIAPAAADDQTGVGDDQHQRLQHLSSGSAAVVSSRSWCLPPGYAGARPVEFDERSPNPARVWDGLTGGKNNFAADREVIATVLKFSPGFSTVITENQEFRERACTYLVHEVGITQFLDCGVGIPTPNPIHDVVQSINPDAKVLYVDHDPMVVAHARALLATNDNTEVIAGNIFNPKGLLRDETVQAFLDWSQPIAILQTATLHQHCGEVAAVAKVMKAYVAAAAAGSCTVISDLHIPEDPELVQDALQAEQGFCEGMGPVVRFRSLDEIRALFPGQHLLENGVVACRDWPTKDDDDKRYPYSAYNAARNLMAGGIGQKPGPQ